MSNLHKLTWSGVNLSFSDLWICKMLTHISLKVNSGLKMIQINGSNSI